jgi:hypothetical protein
MELVTSHWGCLAKERSKSRALPQVLLSCHDLTQRKALRTTHKMRKLFLITMPWRCIEEWRYSSTHSSPRTRWRWVFSFTPLPLYPQGKSPWYRLDRRLCGPQSRSACGEEKNSQPLTGLEPPIIQLVADTDNNGLSMSNSSLVNIPPRPLSLTPQLPTVTERSKTGTDWRSTVIDVPRGNVLP